jgi:hypothetical protein
VQARLRAPWSARTMRLIVSSLVSGDARVFITGMGGGGLVNEETRSGELVISMIANPSCL